MRGTTSSAWELFLTLCSAVTLEVLGKRCAGKDGIRFATCEALPPVLTLWPDIFNI